MSGIYPSPEHIEHIQFDGRDCVVLSPEDYEEMHFDITRLRARVAELTADVESRAEDCELNYKTILELRKIITEQDAALAKREAVAVNDVIEKIEEYGGHRENEGGSYATFQKSEARRYMADADEVLAEIRAMLAASKGETK